MTDETQLRVHVADAESALARADLDAAQKAALQALLLDPRRDESLRLFGRIHYLYAVNKMTVALGRLKTAGFSPAAVADVGAYRGGWMRSMKRAFPGARTLMIEAQRACAPMLEQACAEFPGTVDCRIALLGPEERRNVPFHQMETGSSIYRENTGVPSQETLLDMTTLAAVAADAGYDRFDLVKLDVQGAELDVLAGAGTLLERTEAVLMEASLGPYNIGAPLFAEIVAWMDGRGFQLFDVVDVHRFPPFHTMYQCDVVFTRKKGALSDW